MKEKMIELKVAITNCLLALTEGAQHEIFHEIMQQVRPETFLGTLKFLDTEKSKFQSFLKCDEKHDRLLIIIISQSLLFIL